MKTGILITMLLTKTIGWAMGLNSIICNISMVKLIVVDSDKKFDINIIYVNIFDYLLLRNLTCISLIEK